MSRSSPSRSGGDVRDKLGAPRTGRHRGSLDPPTVALSDVLPDRSLERIRAADRAIVAAQAHLRGTGADSEAVTGAFILARDALNEARKAMREVRRELALALNEWEQLHRRLQNVGPYPEAAAPVVPDVPGLNLFPDPGRAQTPSEFMDRLRTYRKWAGEPSFRAMEHIIRKQRGQHFAASTINTALRSDDLPSLQKVQAIVTACGGSDAHQQMFTTAWRRLAMPPQDDVQPEPRRTLRSARETA